MRKAQSLLEYILIMSILIIGVVAFVMNFDFESLKYNATLRQRQGNEAVIGPMTR